MAIEIVDESHSTWWCSIVMLVYQRVGHRTRSHDFQSTANYWRLTSQWFFPTSIPLLFIVPSVPLLFNNVETNSYPLVMTNIAIENCHFSPHEIPFIVDLPIKNGESWLNPHEKSPWYSQQFCGHQLSTAAWQQLRHRCGRCGAIAWSSAPVLRMDPILKKEWINGIISWKIMIPSGSD